MSDSMLLPLGEVIAWRCAATNQAAMVDALRLAGLDPKMARELAPRNAFSRALKKLSDQRVIRQTAENATEIEFQFTKEAKLDGEFVYSREAMLTLVKRDGSIKCDNAALKAAAESQLDRAFGERTASDVTSIVQRIIEAHGDLFPIRPQGGCYFVPQRFAGLVDQVQKFLGGIGGAVVRFAVAQGNPETERSVRDSMAEGIAGAIAEHEAAVAAFDTDTRPDTIKRAAERIRTAKFKVEAYAALLGEQREKLEASLKDAGERLKLKVAEIGKTMPPEPRGGGGATVAPVPSGAGHAAVAARVPVPSPATGKLFDW